jgi:hypothetical protein
MAHKGWNSGNKSSDKGLSPQGPQTGDGRTRREPADPVKLDKPKK